MNQPFGVVPCVDKFFVGSHGIGHRFAQGIGAIAVHVHFADHGAHTGLFEQLHQTNGRGFVYGTKRNGAHGAHFPQMFDKAAIHFVGIVHIGVFCLFGESVVVQPRQQFHVHGHAHIAILRCVYVQVVHGRNDKFVAKIDNLGRAQRFGQSGTDLANFAVFDHNVTAFDDVELVGSFRKKDMSFVDLHSKIFFACFNLQN